MLAPNLSPPAEPIMIKSATGDSPKEEPQKISIAPVLEVASGLLTIKSSNPSQSKSRLLNA